MQTLNNLEHTSPFDKQRGGRNTVFQGHVCSIHHAWGKTHAGSKAAPLPGLLHRTLHVGSAEAPQGWLETTKLLAFQANETPVLSLSERQSIGNYYYYCVFNEPALPQCSPLPLGSICLLVGTRSSKLVSPCTGGRCSTLLCWADPPWSGSVGVS